MVEHAELNGARNLGVSVLLGEAPEEARVAQQGRRRMLARGSGRRRGPCCPPSFVVDALDPTAAQLACRCQVEADRPNGWEVSWQAGDLATCGDLLDHPAWAETGRSGIGGSRSSVRQLRVIFATQQAELADLVERGLAPFGIQTSRHDSLLGLYPAVLKEEPDVVLLDAELPRLALEAAVRFLRTKGASRRQPILLLVPSGDDAPDPGLLVTSCQADDFIERAAPYSK